MDKLDQLDLDPDLTELEWKAILEIPVTTTPHPFRMLLTHQVLSDVDFVMDQVQITVNTSSSCAGTGLLCSPEVLHDSQAWVLPLLPMTLTLPTLLL